MAAIYSNGGNRWNILGFNFTKRDALSSVYKISMVKIRDVIHDTRIAKRVGYTKCPHAKNEVAMSQIFTHSLNF
jgi:hypothetical protein